MPEQPKSQQSPQQTPKPSNMNDLALLCYEQMTGGDHISEISRVAQVVPEVVEQIFNGEMFSLAIRE